MATETLAPYHHATLDDVLEYLSKLATKRYHNAATRDRDTSSLYEAGIGVGLEVAIQNIRAYMKHETIVNVNPD